MFGSELMILTPFLKACLSCYCCTSLVSGRWLHHSHICPRVWLSQIQRHNIKTIYKSSEARGFFSCLFVYFQHAVSPLNTETPPVLKCDAELCNAAEKVECCGLSGVAAACSRSVSMGFLWFLPTIHCVWGLRLTPRCVICSF